MKSLTYLGKELDPNLEIELQSRFVMGFKVTVQYSADGTYGHLSKDKPVVFRNVSEFHNLWEPNKIAIESDDIHRTGRTNLWDDIDWVTIEMDTENADCFSTYNQ